MWIHINLYFQFLQTSEKIEPCYLQYNFLGKISLTFQQLDHDVHNHHFEDHKADEDVDFKLKHSNQKDKLWYNDQIGRLTYMILEPLLVPFVSNYMQIQQ